MRPPLSINSNKNHLLILMVFKMFLLKSTYRGFCVSEHIERFYFELGKLEDVFNSWEI